jgi:hypothetical protein
MNLTHKTPANKHLIKPTHLLIAMGLLFGCEHKTPAVPPASMPPQATEYIPTAIEDAPVGSAEEITAESTQDTATEAQEENSHE